MPAELPKDASKMFEDSLQKYLSEITERGEIDYETIDEELKTGNIVYKGSLTSRYSYLDSS